MGLCECESNGGSDDMARRLRQDGHLQGRGETGRTTTFVLLLAYADPPAKQADAP